MTNCIKCKQPITETNRIGRSKSYCSTACRRAAGLEIQRINGRLIKLEDLLQNIRLGMGFVHDKERKEKGFLAEIERQENRLKELFAGTDD